MALVVLLRGLNVGGHQRFRPTALATQLAHLDVVNIGAAGTFVVRRPVRRADLRAEIERRLPFDAEVAIVEGRDLVALLSGARFPPVRSRAEVVRFVSVLARRPTRAPVLPITLPARGRWLVKVLAREGPFVLGMYRRDMRVIGYLDRLDGAFGAPLTTRSWNTLAAIARRLRESTS